MISWMGDWSPIPHAQNADTLSNELADADGTLLHLFQICAAQHAHQLR